MNDTDDINTKIISDTDDFLTLEDNCGILSLKKAG